MKGELKERWYLFISGVQDGYQTDGYQFSMNDGEARKGSKIGNQPSDMNTLENFAMQRHPRHSIPLKTQMFLPRFSRSDTTFRLHVQVDGDARSARN